MFIGLISVGGAATEESTAAIAVGQTPGKTVAIAADASTFTDFPYGQIGTGRLSFRLRKLQRNAKHPAFYDSLRSVKTKAESRFKPFSPENCLRQFSPPKASKHDTVYAPQSPQGKMNDSKHKYITQLAPLHQKNH